MDNVVFYKKNTSCYFRYCGKEFVLTSKNLAMLRQNILFPANIVFKDISLEKTKRILDYFDNWNVNIDFKVLDNCNGLKKYVAIISLIDEKLVVPVYKIISEKSFKLVDNVNPYKLFKDIGYLFEIDINTVRNNKDYDCYWLERDLDNKQKEKLSDNYQELVVDAIYSYNKDAMNSKNVKRLVKKID